MFYQNNTMTMTIASWWPDTDPFDSTVIPIIVICLTSAYVQALTGEKVYAITWQEFGPWQGKILILVTALYSLKWSGAMWHQKLSDNRRDMWFRPCHADFDLCMRDRGDHFEYIAVKVDDQQRASLDNWTLTENMGLFFEGSWITRVLQWSGYWME